MDDLSLFTEGVIDLRRDGQIDDKDLCLLIGEYRAFKSNQASKLPAPVDHRLIFYFSQSWMRPLPLTEAE